MTTISDKQITAYVEANIGTFHDKRLEALNKLRLRDLLRRKNPYLFKSKNLVVVADLIRSLLDAHLSSQEETLFGDRGLGGLCRRDGLRRTKVCCHRDRLGIYQR